MSDAPRHARQLSLPEVGPDGQARLAATTVLIVGVGGLGCPAALYLAGAGIGRLVLNDFDRVDASNLPRQILFSPADIGAAKVDAARDALTRLQPGTEVATLGERLGEAALAVAVADADIVVDATDNIATRLAVNAACVRQGRPLVSGAAVRLEGQLAVFENRGAGPCYRCAYDDADEWLGDCQGTGVLAPVPGVIGTLMAVETLLLALGRRPQFAGRMLLWDGRSGDLTTIRLKPKAACPVCGG